MLESIPYCNSTIYILLAAYGTFSKLKHILGHKESLNKYKNIEITSCI
jgi:hypothetical protein